MFYIIPYKNYTDAMCCDGTNCVLDAVQEQIDSDKLYIQDTNDLVVETVSSKKLLQLLTIGDTIVEGLDVTEEGISIVCEEFDCFYSEDSMRVDYGSITLDRSNGLSVYKNGVCKTVISFKLLSEDEDENEYIWLVSVSDKSSKKYFNLTTNTDEILIEGVQFVKSRNGYTFVGFFTADDEGSEIVNIGVRLNNDLSLRSIDCVYFNELSNEELKSYARKKLLGGI